MSVSRCAHTIFMHAGPWRCRMLFVNIPCQIRIFHDHVFKPYFRCMPLDDIAYQISIYHIGCVKALADVVCPAREIRAFHIRKWLGNVNKIWLMRAVYCQLRLNDVHKSWWKQTVYEQCRLTVVAFCLLMSCMSLRDTNVGQQMWARHDTCLQTLAYTAFH